MRISDWFKRLRAREGAQAVEHAEEKVGHKGVPAGDLPADRGSIDADLDQAIDKVEGWSQTPD